MRSQTTAFANKMARHNEPDFSEHARKLVAYSRECREENPTSSPMLCMAMAAGKLIGEYGDEREHVANAAMKEVAAKWVFG